MSFSPSIPLTFGVELEGIFAFHHDKLEEHLQAHLPSATIIKTLDSDQRKALRQKAYPDQLYQSWAMANAGENSMTASASVLHEAGFIRAYKDEPLHVAKNLFSATKVGKDIVLHNPENHSKPEEYKSWILTSDHSIVSLENSEKITAFPSKIPSSKVDKWDTYGIELVSPPYLSTELCSAQEDISSLFSALQSPSSSAITINETCGLHVHVDLASDECLPIKAIQHLAFLCIIYEDEISRLHLGHRRQRRTEIESNRINFVSEYPSPGDTISRTVIDEETGSEVVKKFAVQFSMKLTRRLILNRQNGPQTIEFRQHAGSVDGVEVMYWVRFCLALVRLAMRYVDERRECGVKKWDDRIDLEDLMGEIGLDGETRGYYESKTLQYDTPDAPETLNLWIEAYEDEFDEEESV